MGKQVNTKNKIEKRPLSLAPTSLDEAVTDIVKIKSQQKCRRRRN
jgi:hypothetical protein